MQNDGTQVQPRHCLIVEDSTFDQQMMRRAVGKTQEDIRVSVVPTIDAARRALARDDVSFILLDNNLPDGKGANFALELSEHASYSRIPIMIVSDWPSPFMFQKAELAGVSRVVNKSEFGPALLREAFGTPARVH